MRTSICLASRTDLGAGRHDAGRLDQRLGKLVVDGAAERLAGDLPVAVEVDAELLDRGALDLRDRDLEHHLVLAPDSHRIDDLPLQIACGGLRDAHEALGDVDRLLGLKHGIGLAGQNDRVADADRADLRMRQRRGESLLQQAGLAADLHLQRRDLAPVGIERHDRGRAVRDADHEELARSAHHRVGDGRIGDEHLLGVARQVDHDRTPDAHLDRPRHHAVVGAGLHARARHALEGNGVASALRARRAAGGGGGDERGESGVQDALCGVHGSHPHFLPMVWETP
jgi:hypothetical protein